MPLKVKIEKRGDFYNVSGGQKRHSKSVSTMDRNEALRIARARKRLSKPKKFTFSFNGRLATSIGKTYRIRVTETGFTAKEAFKKINNKYDHITVIKVNGKETKFGDLV